MTADPRPVNLKLHRIRFRTLILIACLGLVAAEVTFARSYLIEALQTLRNARIGWLVVAFGAEMVSMSAFARVQHRILRAGGMTVSIRRLTGLIFAANALDATLPAGTALSTAYSFRYLRRWGASVPLAGFTLFSAGALSTVTFALLGLITAFVAGGGQADVVLLGVAAVIAFSAIFLGRHYRRGPDSVARAAARGLRLVNRLRHREPSSGQDRLETVLGELAQIKPRHRDWALAFVFAASNWAADLLCLVLCAKAVNASGTTVAIAMVAYLAGMTASSISFLPGGLGVVDAAMIFGLAHGGVTLASATAAVVLYRLVSLLFIVVLGWVVVSFTWRADHRERIVATPTRRPLAAPRCVAVPRRRNVSGGHGCRSWERHSASKLRQPGRSKPGYPGPAPIVRRPLACRRSSRVTPRPPIRSTSAPRSK